MILKHHATILLRGRIQIGFLPRFERFKMTPCHAEQQFLCGEVARSEHIGRVYEGSHERRAHGWILPEKDEAQARVPERYQTRIPLR